MYIVQTAWLIVEDDKYVDWGIEHYVAFTREEAIDIVNELKRQNHTPDFKVTYDETPDHYGTWYREEQEKSSFAIAVYPSVNYNNEESKEVNNDEE